MVVGTRDGNAGIVLEEGLFVFEFGDEGAECCQGIFANSKGFACSVERGLAEMQWWR